MDISFFKLDMADTTGSVSKEAPGRVSQVDEADGNDESFAEVMSAEKTRLDAEKPDRGYRDDAVKDCASADRGVGREDATGEDDTGDAGRSGGEGDGSGGEWTGRWAGLTSGFLTSTGATAAINETDADGSVGSPLLSSSEGDVAATDLTGAKTGSAGTGLTDGSTTGGFALAGTESVSGLPSDLADARTDSDRAGTARVEDAWATGNHTTAAAHSFASEDGSAAKSVEMTYAGAAGPTSSTARNAGEEVSPTLGSGLEGSGDVEFPGNNKTGEKKALITEGEAAADGDGAAAPEGAHRSAAGQGADTSAAGAGEDHSEGVLNRAASAKARTDAPGEKAATAEAPAGEVRRAVTHEAGTTAALEQTAEGEAGYVTVSQGSGRSAGKETGEGAAREVRSDDIGVRKADEAVDDGHVAEGHDLFTSDEGEAGDAASGGNKEEGGPALFDDAAEEHHATAASSSRGKASGPARIADAPATATVQSAPGDVSTRPGGEAQPAAAAQTVRPEPAEVYEKFGEGVRISLGQGGREVKIKLNPEALGRLHIKLSLNDATVSARILVENPAVKSLLEGDMARVREMFASQGLSLDDYTVELSADSNDGFTGGGERYAARDHDVNGGGGKEFGHAMGEFEGHDGQPEGFGTRVAVNRTPWHASPGQSIGGGTSSKGVDIFA